MNENKMSTAKLAKLAMMTAVSLVLLLLVRIPWPPAPFLVYDPADVPIYITAFAFIIINKNNVAWERGDAYGFEFAEIQLPHNFIFGSDSDCPTSAANSIKEIGTIMRFRAGANSGSGSSSGISGASTITISNIRPSKDGTLKAQTVGNTKSPDSRRR